MQALTTILSVHEQVINKQKWTINIISVKPVVVL